MTVPEKSGMPLGIATTVVDSAITMVVSDQPDSSDVDVDCDCNCDWDWAKELPAMAKAAMKALEVIMLA